METDKGKDNFKRQYLSGSSLRKLIIVSLILCMLLLANHYSLWTHTTEDPSKLDQQNISNVTSNVQESVKNVTKVGKEERAGYATANMGLKAHVTKYFNKTKDYRDGIRRQKVTNYLVEDGATKYVMHKFLNDNGPSLSPKQRAQFVKDRCQTFLKENNIRLNPNNRYTYDHKGFFLSRFYNISVCYSLKVASTNTRRLLYALDHSYGDGLKRITTSAAYKYAESRERTFPQLMSDKPLINIMIVREPLERLLSAHRDNRAFMTKTFKEYLQLTLNGTMKTMNRHIYPFFEKCRPCEMQYDFVVRQHHFYDDFKIALKEIDSTRKVNIPERNKTGYNFAPSEKLLQQYFGKIPNDLVRKLWIKYYKDYYIFGFPYPAHLMN